MLMDEDSTSLLMSPPTQCPCLNGSLGQGAGQAGQIICEKSIKIMFLIAGTFACVMAKVFSLDYATTNSGMATRHVCHEL